MNILIGVCYLCNVTEAGDTRRDCACTGATGHVHYSCLCALALAANAAWVWEDGIDAYLRPWKECGICHHPYQGRFGVTMAVHHVQTLRESGRIEVWKGIEAKYLLLSAQMGLRNRLSDLQKREVMGTAEYVMQLIGRLPVVLRRWVSIKSNCVQARGVMMLMQGGPESIRMALREFQIQREIAATNEDQVGCMRANRLVEYLEDGEYHEGGNLEDFVFELTLVD